MNRTYDNRGLEFVCVSSIEKNAISLFSYVIFIVDILFGVTISGSLINGLVWVPALNNWTEYVSGVTSI